MGVINFERKKMIPLTESLNHMLVKKTVTFAKKNLKKKMLIIRNILKLEIIAITQVNTKLLHIAYVI